MSPDAINLLTAAAVGLVAGAIGSVIAPWVNWGIEKRRKRHENRAALIERWRTIIANPSFERNLMLDDATYGALRPLLSAEANKQLHRPSNSIIAVRGGSGPGHADRVLLQREIARIEREWGLV